VERVDEGQVKKGGTEGERIGREREGKSGEEG